MLWIVSRQRDCWLQESNSRPQHRANVVLYVEITATNIMVIIMNVLIIKRVALSATGITPCALAQHIIAGLTVNYRVFIT
jgi:hypothetical protein